MSGLLRRIWENRGQIWEGLLNRVLKPNNPLAKSRRKICDTCPFNSKNTKDRPFGNLPYNHCTGCGCSLNIKPWAEDTECPYNKW